MPEYIPGRTIEEIKKEYNLKEVNKLASNENLFGPHSGVIKEICKSLNDIKYYPDGGSRGIRQKLGKKYDISIDSIIMGNGTDQIIEMICDSFIEPGENVIITDPTFLIYEKSALKCNGAVIRVPLKEYRQDIEKIVSSINAETGIVFITNPHNPTGTNITRQEFDYMIENINSNVLLVIDEAQPQLKGVEVAEQRHAFFGKAVEGGGVVLPVIREREFQRVLAVLVPELCPQRHRCLLNLVRARIAPVISTIE